MPDPTQTTLSQQCTVRKDATGTVRFEIVSTVEDLKPNDLPSIFVFVHDIISVPDPKEDTFRRVANVLDLTELPRGRSAALTAGKKTYLASSVTVSYGDVETATQAKAVIQARVDTLITEWIAYSTAFNSETVNLPLVSPSIIAARKTAYYDAKAAKAAADAAVVTATTAKSAADADVGRAEAAYTHALEADLFLQKCDDEVALHNEAAFVAALAAFRVVETSPVTAQGALTNARTAAASAASALSAANADVVAREADLAAALAALLEVCPTFVDGD